MAEEKKKKVSRFRSAQDFIKKGRTARAITTAPKKTKSSNPFINR